MNEEISKEEIEHLRKKVDELRVTLTRLSEQNRYGKQPQPKSGNYFFSDKDGTLLEISHRDALRVMDERRRKSKLLASEVA
ncbi:hypothetical protein [Leptospira kmetyi]|uniref:hypothetical protein n=1 Tax=Leptospira kmetyi TaxID=408139 RepID=UPI0002887CBB|nr:hypothetical protein [Leptospira kmetyi]EQA55408.1 hypothetical protein LEP1GSC052_0003 [Leptospira kmetyi serovar Malaysia str. Bejo-Iso9]